MQPYSESDMPNFDDMSDDAAATEFENTFGNLVSNSSGTPEEVALAVDDLLETLNSCITKSATLEELVGYVFDSAAGGQVIHYAASNFLAHLTEKFTREVEGKSLAKVVITKMRHVSEQCVAVMEQLARGDADPSAVMEARNAAMFFADLAPKVLLLSSFKMAIPAVIYGIFELMEKLVAKSDTTIPKADFLENCYCAVQMLKLTGPVIDELIRDDPTISIKIPGVVPKLYQTIRNILIDSSDLNSRIRAGIVKVLEFRASRWGEVPSPDKPLETGQVGGLDEVDPTWYGPDNVPLSKEESEFLNAAANEVARDSDDEDDVDEGEPYTMDGPAYDEAQGGEENLAPSPVWRYIPEEVPSAAMEEFRRRLKPDYKPDGAGDRLRTN